MMIEYGFKCQSLGIAKDKILDTNFSTSKKC